MAAEAADQKLFLHPATGPWRARSPLAAHPLRRPISSRHAGKIQPMTMRENQCGAGQKTGLRGERGLEPSSGELLLFFMLLHLKQKILKISQLLVSAPVALHHFIPLIIQILNINV